MGRAVVDSLQKHIFDGDFTAAFLAYVAFAGGQQFLDWILTVDWNQFVAQGIVWCMQGNRQTNIAHLSQTV